MNKSGKRKRGSDGEYKACAECRRAHKKCDKKRPCARCIEKGLNCTEYEKPFNVQTKKRKISSFRSSGVGSMGLGNVYDPIDQEHSYSMVDKDIYSMDNDPLFSQQEHTKRVKTEDKGNLSIQNNNSIGRNPSMNAFQNFHYPNPHFPNAASQKYPDQMDSYRGRLQQSKEYDGEQRSRYLQTPLPNISRFEGTTPEMYHQAYGPKNDFYGRDDSIQLGFPGRKSSVTGSRSYSLPRPSDIPPSFNQNVILSPVLKPNMSEKKSFQPSPIELLSQGSSNSPKIPYNDNEKELAKQVEDLKKQLISVRQNVENPFLAAYSTDIPCAMWKTGSVDKLRCCNESFASLFHHTPDSLLKVPPDEVWKVFDIPTPSLTKELSQRLTESHHLLKRLATEKIVFSGRQKILFKGQKFFEIHFVLENDLMFCKYEEIPQWDNTIYFNNKKFPGSIVVRKVEESLSVSQALEYAKSLTNNLRELERMFHEENF